MAADVWLNTSADGNMNNAANYQSGIAPIATTTISDQSGTGSGQGGLRPTSGTFPGTQWDINGNGQYNQSGDTANFGTAKIIDSFPSNFPSWSMAGADVIGGPFVASTASTLYGTGVLATAAQVQKGVTNGPFTGTLVGQQLRSRGRLG